MSYPNVCGGPPSPMLPLPVMETRRPLFGHVFGIHETTTVGHSHSPTSHPGGAGGRSANLGGGILGKSDDFPQSCPGGDLCGDCSARTIRKCGSGSMVAERVRFLKPP